LDVVRKNGGAKRMKPQTRERRREETMISSATVNVAAEFAVASELGRRNIYAQPAAFGNRLRTELLISGAHNHRLLRLEVKGKQYGDWPNCKGICGENVMLVFVDFAGKEENDRPDFYILTVEDWIDFVKGVMTRFPDKEIELDKKNVLIWMAQRNRKGVPYTGSRVRVIDIAKHKERWDKITSVVEQITDRITG
jgi:hypothetical protein